MAAPQAFVDYEGEGGVGNEWVFIYRPRNTSIAAQQVAFVNDEFAPSKVALLCVNNPFGTASCDVMEADSKRSASRSRPERPTSSTPQT